MQPGRELDALVAEKVMGCKIGSESRGPSCLCPYNDHAQEIVESNTLLKEYSTDIAAAWEVVEKLKNMPTKSAKEMNADLSIDYCGDSGWWVGWRWHEWTDDGALAPTAPHAICLAALKAVDNS